MAITRQILYDGPDRTDWRESDPSIGYEGYGTDWKQGSPAFNTQQLRQRAQQALAQLEDNYTNWPTMTAAQKDAANRLAQRSAAALIRIALSVSDTPGV